VIVANSLIEDTASAFFSEMHGHQVRDCGCPLRRASLLDLSPVARTPLIRGAESYGSGFLIAARALRGSGWLPPEPQGLTI
jgi:hypothetical protein